MQKHAGKQKHRHECTAQASAEHDSRTKALHLQTAGATIAPVLRLRRGSRGGRRSHPNPRLWSPTACKKVVVNVVCKEKLGKARCSGTPLGLGTKPVQQRLQESPKRLAEHKSKVCMRGASLAPVSKLAPWQNTTSDLRVVVKIRQKLMQTPARKTVLTYCWAEHAAAKSMMQNEGCRRLRQNCTRIRWSRRPRRGTGAGCNCCSITKEMPA